MHWAAWDFTLQLPLPVALSAMALVGYMVGRARREALPAVKSQARRELKRGQLIARELEAITKQVQQQVNLQQNHLAHYKHRIGELLQQESNTESWQELCREADLLLQPTQRLVTQLASAYDELRQQCAQLQSFTEVRTDPLTGVCNRRALDESLDNKIAMLNRYDSGFALVILDIDHFKKLNDEQGHLYGDEVLTLVAKLLDQNVRDTDQVTRYGGEEFVILMPHTSLEGAAIFSNRLRERVALALPVTISIGVALGTNGDSQQSLLGRADAALYAAKHAGRNQVWLHDGVEVVSYQHEQAELTPQELNLIQRTMAKKTARASDKTTTSGPTAAELSVAESEAYALIETDLASSRQRLNDSIEE